MARDTNGKFISKKQTGGGKSALRMKGSPASVSRERERREERRERRESLQALIRR